MLINKIGSSNMYLDITLNGASFERQEQYERLFYKKSRQRRKSTDHIPLKKIKRSIQCHMSLLNYVSLFFKLFYVLLEKEILELLNYFIFLC